MNRREIITKAKARTKEFERQIVNTAGRFIKDTVNNESTLFYATGLIALGLTVLAKDAYLLKCAGMGVGVFCISMGVIFSSAKRYK